MKINKVQLTKSRYSIILLLFVAIIIGLFTYYTIWLGDDIRYGYIFNFNPKAENINSPISSLGDVFASQYVHYFTSNGRFLAHVLVQSFIGLGGHLAFAIANALMYIAFFVLLAKLIGARLSDFKALVSIVIVGLLTFQTKMMPSCQIGFVWMFTLTMSVIWIFFKYTKRINKVFALLIGVYALIAGNGQEALNIGVAGAFGLYLLFNFRKASFLQYCIAIGFILGTAAICLSPASMNRGMETMGGNSWKDVFLSSMMHLTYLRAVFFLWIIVIYAKFKHGISWKKIYKENAFFWNTWIILFCFNILIVFESNRSCFGIELMSIIIAFRLLTRKQMTTPWIIVLGIILVLNFIWQAKGIEKIRHYDSVCREKLLENNDEIVFMDFDFSNPITGCRLFGGIDRLMLNESYTELDASYLNYINLLYGQKKNLKVLPTFLENKLDQDIGNQLIELNKMYWLAVQSKSEPTNFILGHRPDIINRFMKPTLIKFDENNALETDFWRARIVSRYDYPLSFCSNLEME